MQKSAILCLMLTIVAGGCGRETGSPAAPSAAAEKNRSTPSASPEQGEVFAMAAKQPGRLGFGLLPCKQFPVGLHAGKHWGSVVPVAHPAGADSGVTRHL
jgi:hypothetical protein